MVGLGGENRKFHDSRMAWWREARFGMFIHWGLYAIPAGVWEDRCVPGLIEWIMHTARIPVKEYEQLAKRFNPVKFNAGEWVRTAKEAGMRYIVITAKHHDGFCMFDTKYTDYNIVKATPFGRDPMKDLAEACEKENVKLGFYYSQTLDWHHPDGLGNDWDYDPSKQNFTRYLREYVKPQLHELLTNYGHVAVLWFDIGTPTPELAQELVAFVREISPDTVISGRLGGVFRYGRFQKGLGDYIEMGDNLIPSAKIEGDWETPATINDSWGYKSWDHNWKSPGRIIQTLVNMVSKGGNYLLNVGPTAEGEIPEPCVRILRDVGEWLTLNGESIYGAEASTVDVPPDAIYRCTAKPGKLYIHVFGWPWYGELKVSSVKRRVKAAYLLADRRELKFKQEGENVIVNVPEKAPNPIDTVVALEI
jgi:alpha-L-fucosidase